MRDGDRGSGIPESQARSALLAAPCTTTRARAAAARGLARARRTPARTAARGLGCALPRSFPGACTLPRATFARSFARSRGLARAALAAGLPGAATTTACASAAPALRFHHRVLITRDVHSSASHPLVERHVVVSTCHAYPPDAVVGRNNRALMWIPPGQFGSFVSPKRVRNAACLARQSPRTTAWPRRAKGWQCGCGPWIRNAGTRSIRLAP
jgi:hypothetical protein